MGALKKQMLVETGVEVTKEQKVEEAVKRMKALKISEYIISKFSETGKLYCGQSGIYRELDDRYKKLVDEFETEHNGVVYHLIFTECEFGDTLSMLFVSKYVEEWKLNMDGISEDTVVAYVENLDMPCFSEFGIIGVELKNGVLCRTW